jgi:hypothetical protein
MKIINKNIIEYRNDKGLLHREDGPAFIDKCGYRAWYYNGELHNLSGPAIIFPEKSIEVWLINGKKHRLDGPASKHGDYYQWFINNKLSRLDGPAVECHYSNVKEYWIDGKKYPYKTWIRAKSIYWLL